MRLFIAIKLDTDMKQLVGSIQNSFRRQNIRGNYTPDENLHLTLAFIGEYGNPDEVLDVLESVPFRSVPISFSDVYIYREMCLVSIARNPGLESYVRRLRRALAESGIPFDKKNFKAHITLVRRAVLKNGLPENLLKESGLDTTDADTVELFQSTQGKHGMIYTALGSISG